MADPTTDQSPALPQALAEPTVHVRRSWITGLGLASLGMWMASYTPLQVMLPLQLQHITPHHKIVALAVVSGAGAIASGLATPVAGALSDRTTRKYALGRMDGRRHRWTLGMALLAAISLAVLSVQASVLGVTVLWVLFSAFQNGEYASLSAAIPDHVPVRQRATVAGWVGMPQALGLVVGTILVVEVFTGQISGYVALAVLLVVFALPFVLRTPDYPLEAEHRGLQRQDGQAERGEQRHAERPAVPPAGHLAQRVLARGAVGQRPGHRGGQARGDRARAAHHREGDDLVVRRDVLQLQREEHLQRGVGGHPHAQAGQAQAGDPAPAHVHGRLGQGAGHRLQRIGCLVGHGHSSCVWHPPRMMPHSATF